MAEVLLLLFPMLQSCWKEFVKQASACRKHYFSPCCDVHGDVKFGSHFGRRQLVSMNARSQYLNGQSTSSNRKLRRNCPHDHICRSRHAVPRTPMVQRLRCTLSVNRSSVRIHIALYSSHPCSLYCNGFQRLTR